ncbi:hypothetical protein ACRWQN_03885 [Shewanella sp. HL-SH8]|uniref:hypothetical protein n=1 Tax=unclassified Shewanella TaxID=196818 RepID=UPI003EB87461
MAAISYEENATEVTLSMPAKNFTGNVYVHLNTENMLQGSAFMANLALLIENTEKINMPGLELKSVLDDSVGVYHYFDNNPDISINDYRGSCYTLSDEIGECTFYLLKKEIFVKFDFPYSSLSSWKEILRNTDEQISKLFC